MLWLLPFSCLQSVFFKIKTAVYGRLQFLWFQLLITRTANSNIRGRGLSIRYRITSIIGCVLTNCISFCGMGGTRYYVHHCRFGSC